MSEHSTIEVAARTGKKSAKQVHPSAHGRHYSHRALSSSDVSRHTFGDYGGKPELDRRPSSLSPISSRSAEKAEKEAIRDLKIECKALTIAMKPLKRYTKEWFFIQFKLQVATEELEAMLQDHEIYYKSGVKDRVDLEEKISLFPTPPLVAIEQDLSESQDEDTDTDVEQDLEDLLNRLSLAQEYSKEWFKLKMDINSLKKRNMANCAEKDDTDSSQETELNNVQNGVPEPFMEPLDGDTPHNVDDSCVDPLEGSNADSPDETRNVDRPPLLEGSRGATSSWKLKLDATKKKITKKDQTDPTKQNRRRSSFNFFLNLASRKSTSESEK